MGVPKSFLSSMFVCTPLVLRDRRTTSLLLPFFLPNISGRRFFSSSLLFTAACLLWFPFRALDFKLRQNDGSPLHPPRQSSSLSPESVSGCQRKPTCFLGKYSVSSFLFVLRHLLKTSRFFPVYTVSNFGARSLTSLPFFPRNSHSQYLSFSPSRRIFLPLLAYEVDLFDSPQLERKLRMSLSQVGFSFSERKTLRRSYNLKKPLVIDSISSSPQPFFPFTVK